MMILKKNVVVITALLITSGSIAMNWNNLGGQYKNSTFFSSVSIPTLYTSTQPSVSAKPVTNDNSKSQSDAVQNIITTPTDLLPELMAAMVEQGLANGTFALETLPIELRPFVHINSDDSSDATEEVAETEEESMANYYVSSPPEFKCPDPEDPGPHWRGPHAKMILEGKGCTVY